MSRAAPASRRVLARGLLVGVAAAAVVVIATSATWRLAVLAALVAVLVAAARLRFAFAAAVVLLAVVALLAATGRTAGNDPRPVGRTAAAGGQHHRPDGPRTGAHRHRTR
jgi:energy-coupling factor transporter transmembrane protein EcfT